MKLLLCLAAALFAAGCAAKKQLLIPMKQPAKVAMPGAVRTLMFDKVSGDDENSAMVKAMLSAEFSGSSFAVLNDELLDIVKKSGRLPAYLSEGGTVATDFVQQMIGDPGSIGVVEVDLRTSFTQNFSVEARDLSLTTTTWSGGAPRAQVQHVRIPVHRVDVAGSVAGTVRIRSPYPDGQVVFEKSYTVPDFRYSSVEAAPRDLFFFSKNEAAKQGNAAPTLVEVKAIQFKKLVKAFYEDIHPSSRDEAVVLDKRGDKLAYNLLAYGAFPWAERRLRSVGKNGDVAQQAANHYNFGVCWEAQGFTAESAMKYKSALDLEPGNSLFQRAYNRVAPKNK